MKRTISISYTLQGERESSEVVVTYQVVEQAKVLLIACEVVPQAPAVSVPLWLRVRKFELEGVLTNGRYNQLYRDSNYDGNLDTTLFIDTAYDAIMRQENTMTV